MTDDYFVVLCFTNIQLEHMADDISFPKGIHRIFSTLESTSSVSNAQHSLGIDELIEEGIVVSFSFVDK